MISPMQQQLQIQSKENESESDWASYSYYTQHAIHAVHQVATALPWLNISNASNPSVVVVRQSSSSQAQNNCDDDIVVQPPEKQVTDLQQGSNLRIEALDLDKSSTTLFNDKEKKSIDEETAKEEDDDSSIDGGSDELDYDEMIRHKLSVRAYHILGNDWCEDWQMYMKNNHLVFGLCCHHSLHPVQNKHRFILLLGSLAFGLIVTNLVFYFDDRILTENVLSLGNKIYNDTELLAITEDINIAGQHLELDTSHMTILWTIGSMAHSTFDFGLWHLIACGHCNQRNDLGVAGWGASVFLVMVIVSLTTVSVYFRAFSPEEGENEDEFLNSTTIEEEDSNSGFHTVLDYVDSENEQDFRFLFGYMIEIFLSLFVYTPLVQTVVFSGVLGCGCIPFLGGRPQSVRNAVSEENVRRVEV